jgi:hypothetical protein
VKVTSKLIEHFGTYLAAQVRLLGHTPHPLQMLMADFIQGLRPEWVHPRKVILGFRYLTKTFTLRQYVKWRWLRNPHMQVIIHSATRPLAKRQAKAILKALESDELTQDLAPQGEHGDYDFNLRGIEPEQGCSLICAGIKTSLTSSRADLYIFDDPEPDDEPDVLHDRILRAYEEAAFILHPANRWLDRFREATGDPKLAYVPVPEQTQFIVVGQPHTETTAYIPPPPGLLEDDEEVHHPLADAIYLRVPAVNKNGAWLWPQKWRSERTGRVKSAAQVKRAFQRRTWRLQMEIRISPLRTGTIIDTNMIRACHRRVPAPMMFLDPADAGECEWGVAIGGLCERDVHVLDLIGLRGEVYEGDDETTQAGSTWARIFDIAQELGVKEVHLEKNYKAARVACRRYLSKRKLRITVYDYAAKANKHRRILESLETPIRNGMITAEPHVFADPRNVVQLTGLTYDRLPKLCDRADALAALVAHFLEQPALTMAEMLADRKRGYRHVAEQYRRLRITRSPYEWLSRLRNRA